MNATIQTKLGYTIRLVGDHWECRYQWVAKLMDEEYPAGREPEVALLDAAARFGVEPVIDEPQGAAATAQRATDSECTPGE